VNKLGMIITSLPLVLMILCFGRCAHTEKLADQAVPTDFNGKWVGAWSWNKTNRTMIEIQDTKVIVSHFPFDGSYTISTAGIVDFQEKYGERRSHVSWFCLPTKINGSIFTSLRISDGWFIPLILFMIKSLFARKRVNRFG
jgi:hypothetical protein